MRWEPNWPVISSSAHFERELAAVQSTPGAQMTLRPTLLKRHAYDCFNCGKNAVSWGVPQHDITCSVTWLMDAIIKLKWWMARNREELLQISCWIHSVSQVWEYKGLFFSSWSFPPAHCDCCCFSMTLLFCFKTHSRCTCNSLRNTTPYY